jgi:hypothetical protein
MKDGYVVKSYVFSWIKKVVGHLSASYEISTHDLQEEEYFKINAEAPVLSFSVRQGLHQASSKGSIFRKKYWKSQNETWQANDINFHLDWKKGKSSLEVEIVNAVIPLDSRADFMCSNGTGNQMSSRFKGIVGAGSTDGHPDIVKFTN